MSETKRTIFLIRHGLRADSNPDDWSKTLGHEEDPDLCEIGIEMARLAAIRLVDMGERIDYLISSPFLRALRTAHFFAEALNKPINVHYGVHEQMDPRVFNTIPPVLPPVAQRAREFARVNAGYDDGFRPQLVEAQGDPEGNLHRRVDHGLRLILEQFPGNLLIVTHYAICNVAGKVLAGAYSERYVDMTSFTKLVERDGAWHRELDADADHLLPLVHAQNERLTRKAAAGTAKI